MDATRRSFTAHGGHIVVGQLACVALLVAITAGGTASRALAAPVAFALAVLATCRYRGRWMYQWLGTATGYAVRPRYLADTDPYGLLNLIDPIAEPDTGPAPPPDARPAADAGTDGVRAALLDGGGALAVLELGGDGPAVTDTPLRLPALSGLLPPGRDVTVQLLVATRPARGAGPIGEAYRQLTEGQVAGYRRVLLAVRAATGPDGDPGEALGAALRRVRRRLTADGIGHRGLDGPEFLAALADTAGLDPAPVARTALREGWSWMFLAGLHQVTLRVYRPGGAGGAIGGHLLTRLLALPGALVAVSLAAHGQDVALTVRIGAAGADRCAAAAAAVQQLIDSAGLTAARLSGRQITGLAATLPLGLPVDPEPGDPDGYRAQLAPAGLLAGHNRHGQPVALRLFSARPVRAVLLGGPGLAQVLVLRALAVNAGVVVHTGQPHRWLPFLDAAGLPPELLRLASPDVPAHPPGRPGRPALLVCDNTPPPGRLAGWNCALVRRDILTPADAAMLSRADLVIAQRLSDQAAALAGAALGLGADSQWLTRIEDDMIGLFSPPTVRWAALRITDVEQWLVRSAAGVATGRHS